MKEQEKARNIGQKSDSMNAMDQGLNVISQAINKATGIDKGNDGKIEKGK